MIDLELLRNNPDTIKEEISKRRMDIDVDADILLDQKAEVPYL